MSNATSQMGNAMDSGSRTARDTLHDARDGIGDAAETVRKAARDTARQAGDIGRKGAAKAYDAGESAARGVIGYVNRNPVEAALIGIAGVVIAGLLLRRR